VDLYTTVDLYIIVYVCCDYHAT